MYNKVAESTHILPYETPLKGGLGRVKSDSEGLKLKKSPHFLNTSLQNLSQKARPISLGFYMEKVSPFFDMVLQKLLEKCS